MPSHRNTSDVNAALDQHGVTIASLRQQVSALRAPVLPSTSGEPVDAPDAGTVRYDSATDLIWIFNGTAWTSYASSAGAGIVPKFSTITVDFGAFGTYIESVVDVGYATSGFGYSVLAVGTTADHGPEDFILDGVTIVVTPESGNNVTVRAYAPNGTTGQYSITLRGESTTVSP